MNYNTVYVAMDFVAMDAVPRDYIFFSRRNELIFKSIKLHKNNILSHYETMVGQIM